MPTSFPLLAISKETGIEYGEVLRFAEAQTTLAVSSDRADRDRAWALVSRVQARLRETGGPDWTQKVIDVVHAERMRRQEAEQRS